MQSVKAKLAPGTTYQVEGTAGSFTLVSDQPASVGGTDKGPNPKAFLLMALAACTIQTLQMVAAARKWDLQQLTVTASIDEVDDPKNAGTKITKIDVKIESTGNLTPAELAAIERTAGKCPVLKAFEGPKLVVKQAIKI